MEIQQWATRILSADTLEEKLLDPGVLTDENRGPPIFWDTPSRPACMQFQKHTKEQKLPKPHLHDRVENRIICLHRFAGHELLAVEIMAYALLAFPDAPKHFRKGLANTLQEEQEHVRIYVKRLQEMGCSFGDLPLYKHFWSYVPFLKDPITYISVMSLTFEMANLDFAPMYKASFLHFGDNASAAVMHKILEDEISHVSFGYQWLKKLKNKEVSDWDAWRLNMPSNLPLQRAKGMVFNEKSRIGASIPTHWIEELKRL